MFVETITHAMAFDVGWFIALVMNNLFWVMMFACAGYFLRAGKSAIKSGIFMALYVYIWSDVVFYLGWTFQKAIFAVPAMTFVGIFIYDAFFVKKSWHSCRRALATTVVFCIALVFVNVFMW
jgi:TRAP-type C4-dicarboxylate transport system permease large subunit